MMDNDDRQFLLTAAWLFARHGQGARARTLCEALVEDDPRDGVSAVALAELRLAEGDADGRSDLYDDMFLRILQGVEYLLRIVLFDDRAGRADQAALAAAGALAVLRAADTPPELARAEALLEARALAALGKADEAAKRWRRHLESAKGGTRQWI